MENIKNLHQFHASFIIDCFSIGKDISITGRVLKDTLKIQCLMESFTTVQLIHVSQIQNTKTYIQYILERGARSQLFYFIFMDDQSICWLKEICLSENLFTPMKKKILLVEFLFFVSFILNLNKTENVTAHRLQFVQPQYISRNLVHYPQFQDPNEAHMVESETKR